MITYVVKTAEGKEYKITDVPIEEAMKMLARSAPTEEEAYGSDCRDGSCEN